MLSHRVGRGVPDIRRRILISHTIHDPVRKRDLIDGLRETPVVDQRRDLAFAQASRQEITSLSKHLQPQRHINAGPAQHQKCQIAPTSKMPNRDSFIPIWTSTRGGLEASLLGRPFWIELFGDHGGNPCLCRG